jgi:hypothetical protein
MFKAIGLAGLVALASCSSDTPLPVINEGIAIYSNQTELPRGESANLVWLSAGFDPGACRVSTTGDRRPAASAMRFTDFSNALSATGAVAVVANDGVYLFGGRDSSIRRAPIAPVLTFSKVGELPAGAPVSGAAVAMVGNTIYLIGGFRADGAVTNDVWSTGGLNPVAGWTRASTLPMPLANAAAGVIGGDLYVFGGANGDQANARIFRANAATLNLWADVGVLPSAVSGAAFGIIDGVAYLFGGWAADGRPTSRIQRADIATPTRWVAAGLLPEARANSSLIVSGGAVTLVGGEGVGGPLNSAISAPANLAAWSSAGEMRSASEDDAIVVIDNRAVLLGDGRGTYVDLTEGLPFAYYGTPPWISDGGTGSVGTWPMTADMVATLACGNRQSETTVYLNDPRESEVAEVTRPFSFSASSASLAQRDLPSVVPAGWGMMSPQVIQDGDTTYVPMLRGCDDDPASACMDVMRDGATSISARPLRLGDDTQAVSYQPPNLFLFERSVVSVSWHLADGVHSRIAVDVLDLDSPERAWRRSARIEAHLNYLGGAMSRDGVIFIAGWTGANDNTLSMLRIAPPYSQIDGPQTVADYNGRLQFQPLYPHVLVRDDGSISVLSTLENGIACDPTVNFTAYKASSVFEGRWGSPFREVWSEGAQDTLDGSNGSDCRWGDRRFPTAYLLAPSDDRAYAVILAADVNQPSSGFPVISNRNVTQRVEVRADGRILSRDISAAFAPVFRNALTIDAVALSQRGDGVFVLVANNRGATPRGPTFSAVTTTRDFRSFTPARRLETNQGAGHLVLLAQPQKNTVLPVTTPAFFHSGNLHTDATRSADIYRFRGGLLAGDR